MDFVLSLLQALFHAFLQLLVHPFYYAGLLLVVLQFRRQVMLERKLFHSRLHALHEETWRNILYGFLCGLAVSVPMWFIGVTVRPGTVIVLWVISILLVCLRVRFFCFAYAVGVLGVLKFIFSMIPLTNEGWGGLLWLSRTLAETDMPGLLVLVAVLHLAEAILVRRQGARTAIPLFTEGKRGRIIGAYQMQGFWAVPLFLIAPSTSGTGFSLPWPPLFGGDIWAGALWMIGFPMMIGYAEQTTTLIPKVKATYSSNGLLVYGAAILALAAAAYVWPVLLIAASLAAIGFHEGLIWYSNRRETQRPPLFVHDGRGLKILAVLPGSPAAEMGLEAGEIVHKVNGHKILSKEELHQALRVNSAFCKLEVINLAGQSKFVHKALYSGEHHQLGIVLAPDQDAVFWMGKSESNVWAYFKQKANGVKTKTRPFT